MIPLLNNFPSAMSFREALRDLLDGAISLELAVSYIQYGGLSLFQQETKNLAADKIRIVFTDQMGITQPSAIRHAIESKILIRNYTGSGTYHPKLYLAYDHLRHPIKFLVASSNLSSAAFSNSIEAGILGTDKNSLKIFSQWFDQLYRSQSEEVTPDLLNKMEINWRRSAPKRVRTRLAERRLITPEPKKILPIFPEDLDTLEDIFSTIKLPIGLLNLDYAGNNIRNLGDLKKVLNNWDHVRNISDKKYNKQRSELKLLGFTKEHELTPLGKKALYAADVSEIAFLWCSWLQRANDSEIESFNDRLKAVKRVMGQFWQLKTEVRNFFLENINNHKEKPLLMAIEFLCNANEIVQELSLEDFKTLMPLLEQNERLPVHIQKAIKDYLDNKGSRGWEFPDRKIIPLAWKDTQILKSF
jgi:HKD family nuclease